MATRTKVGIIGTGNILWAYAEGCRIFDNIELAACADLDRARAESKAQEFGIPRALAVDELLADPEIEIVLNLTVPRAHADVSLRALAAGKHVYSEKPLGIDRTEGRAINDLAENIVFLLWGSYAQKKGAIIDRKKHLVLTASHPSPLSAHRGFLGCGHFRAANDYLESNGVPPIDWV